MAIKYDATPGAGKALSSNGVVALKAVTLKGGSAATSFKLYHSPLVAGVPTVTAIFECNTPIAESFEKTFNQSGQGFDGFQLVGPVTYDLVGVGSAVTIEY